VLNVGGGWRQAGLPMFLLRAFTVWPVMMAADLVHGTLRLGITDLFIWWACAGA
jgi:hypothetical protein